MNREFHKWYSPRLHRDMELLVFGHAGTPTIVFPSSQGRFFEYEDRGMVGALAHKLEHGHLQLYCVDSVDAESWYNRWVHPRQRVERHMTYESYVLDEVVPLIRLKNGRRDLAVTGCSFGGYHAVNIALRHPDIVTHCVSMSGAFDMKQFMDGYYDQDVYFNSPHDYLIQMGDLWYLGHYARNWYLLATSHWDMCWNENERLAGAMRAKQMNHRLDVWQDDLKHDWPLWQRMAPQYLG
ncbi:MAG TPA: alpha/beta fold hydrolase [Terriglobales bacterium]|nr:alpha/beta fold hydrolase [Terriglobales bacterium]